jgi:integrase
LDEALIQYLKDTYVHDHLESDEAMRWRREQQPARYATRGHPLDVYTDCREMLEDYDADGLVAYWGDWACQFAEGLGFHLNPRDKAFPSLCRALGEAGCAVWLALDKRIDGVAVETPARPEETDKALKAIGNAQVPSGPSVSLLGLYEKYAAVPGRHPKTVAQWRPYVQHLVDFIGIDDVHAVTHDQLVRWRNFLRDEHTYRGKRLSAKTINDSYMGAAQALFSWAKGDGLIPSNPMLEVTKVRLPSAPKTRSKGFTNEEAAAILTATLKLSASQEGEHLRNAKRWAPWLMAYSGARVNEITQLRKEDVFQKDGFWVMRITPEAGTVKTNEYRLVPLHSHLLDQGFLQFVEGRAQGPLFFDPAKRRSDHAINRQANRLGSALATWVRSLGIEGVMPNHAWRHYFATAGARYGLDHRVTKAITGHASSNVHDKTYISSLPDFVDVLSRELEKIPRFQVA